MISPPLLFVLFVTLLLFVREKIIIDKDTFIVPKGSPARIKWGTTVDGGFILCFDDTTSMLLISMDMVFVVGMKNVLILKNSAPVSKVNTLQAPTHRPGWSLCVMKIQNRSASRSSKYLIKSCDETVVLKNFALSTTQEDR